MNKRIIILSIICFLGLCFEAMAQDSEPERDAELWLDAEISKDLGDKFRISIKEAVRFDNDVQDLKVVFTQASLRFKLNKSLAFTGSYRFSSNERFQYRHRLILASRYRLRVSRFNIDWRLRYERENEARVPLDNRVRNRLLLSYSKKKSKFDFFVSAELFYNFNYRFTDISRWRYVGGIDYEIIDDLGITISLLHQNTFNISRPFSDTALRIGISYKL